MGYALGKYEESTLSFYNSFSYQKAIKKVLAVAACPITKASSNLSDNSLMFNCDKVPWYLYEGTTDDICTVNGVQTFIVPALQKTGKLMSYKEYPTIGHRMKEFETYVHDLFPTLF